MKIQNKKYFCYEIYKNLAIWSHNGQLGFNPCSFFKGYIKKSDNFDFKEVWNSPERQQLKRCVETDTAIPGCQSCYNNEAAGLPSRRQSSKKLYEEYFCNTDIDLDGPSGLDYSVGNLCNLKCVVCGPHNSSAWISDYQQLYPEVSVELFKYKKFEQLEITDTELLKNIQSLHFHGGGEPLLSKNHINLLQAIKEVKGLSDVRIFYNINGTVRVDDHILELWSQCQLIELYFSIDDIEDRFDYQRTGAHWKQVVENLEWYKENMPHNHMFNVNAVWSHLNLYYLDELVDWYQNSFNQNRYGDPTNLIFQTAIDRGQTGLQVKSLPSKTKEILIDKFKNYPKLLELVQSVPVNNNTNYSNFWNYINNLDRIKNTSFEKLCPEWSNLLK